MHVRVGSLRYKRPRRPTPTPCALTVNGAIDCWAGAGGGGGSPDVLRDAEPPADPQSQRELQAARLESAREREYEPQQLQPGL